MNSAELTEQGHLQALTPLAEGSGVLILTDSTVIFTDNIAQTTGTPSLMFINGTLHQAFIPFVHR